MTINGREVPRWARITVIAVLVVAVLGIGSVAVARSMVNGAVPQTALLEGEAAAANSETGNSIDGPVNLLLAGLDAREEGSPGQTDSVLADTIIILHVPATHDRAYLISIPRDWRVDIPAYDKTGFTGSTEKINSAFGYGYQGDGSEVEKRARGMELLSTTLNKETGIRFNGAAIIDFGGFGSVVHALGGVDMCVDERAESIHLGRDANGKLVQGWYSEAYGMQLPPGATPLVHEEGCRRMNATEALDYVRIRKSLSDGDYGRQRHQQQLIKAIVDEATTTGVLTDLGKLNALVKAAGDTFLLDTGGIPLADYVFTFKNLRSDRLTLIRTNAGEPKTETVDGVDYETLDESSLSMLTAAKNGTLDEFLAAHPEFSAETTPAR
ncbi:MULTISPECIES: LCP family protein [Catenuloplanes]|uniref:Anionic cell wall polymer biosynthesis LytR-Cps2A-Psr (LCP) family protein n=1 Tax=Catenuloplanes niger TaxID=587534 RepID=A0AAE4CV83_9ACTN|nr:LCP family protein [Catenuloplanes niger]MDR7325960.1 anionic cell wall polymer biosynthesis LytR-Cps2A-Psr (LCP) family protein [Catenuloplanes niger]